MRFPVIVTSLVEINPIVDQLAILRIPQAAEEIECDEKRGGVRGETKILLNVPILGTSDYFPTIGAVGNCVCIG